jgi:uroporphyrinogen decarboxylase
VPHLTPKDNYLRTVRFGEPEYVPNSRHLPVASIGYNGVNPEDGRVEGTVESWDFWGVKWQQELEGVMPFPRHCPLGQLDRWGDYAWPDPCHPDRTATLPEQAARIDRDQTILAVSHRSTLYERAWELVGMEELLILLGSEPAKIEWLFDHIIEFQIGIAEQYLSFEPDLAQLGDDLGTQLGLFVSPAVFRRHLKPRYARLIELYKRHDVLIEFHSCGNILGLVDDFLELGIDILNPIQPRAIRELQLLRRKTQGRMALKGGVDTQYTLTLGTPEDVRAEVRQRIGVLGRDGGYICGPDQTIPMPEENSRALDDAIAEYGRYPLA